METITLKEFKRLMTNNKSQFLGSLGCKSSLETAIKIIDEQKDKIIMKYDRNAIAKSYGLLFTNNQNEIISRLDLSGTITKYNGLYILQCNDNCIMIYAIQNN